MRKLRFLYMYLLLLAVQLAVAQNDIQQYEYWLDNDYEHREIVQNTGTIETITMDISQLSTGLHYFNFRAKTAGDEWGTLSHYIFYVPPQNETDDSSKEIQQYEYWLDNDYEHHEIVQNTGTIETITMDISQLAIGVHYFNFRAKAASDEWGALSRYIFYVPPQKDTTAPIKKVEYWIDDSAHRLSQEVDGEDVVFTIDISDLSIGTHLLNVHCQTADNEWSIPDSYEFTLDELPRVPTPVISHDGNKVVISDGQGVDTDYPITYYYTLDGTEPTENSMRYEAPFEVTYNLTVKAVGYQYGHNPSAIAELQVDWFKLATPGVTYNGLKVRLSTNEDGAILYYTLDGTSPRDAVSSNKAIEYHGEFAIDNLCQLKVVAVLNAQIWSDEVTYSIDYLFDGLTARVRQGNLLEKAFEWCDGINKVERLAVEGPLSYTDIELLKTAPALVHLDLSKATLTSNRMPDDAFNGSGLVSFVSPYNFSSAGGQLFANCSKLAAVVWNASMPLNADALEGVDNPNLLLYVNNKAYAPASVTNVVVDGVAEKIVLTDKETGNSDFYCPQVFTANNISYTHHFKMQTGTGASRGWETITLPFTVQAITHERNGQLRPFAAAGDGKPFWLLQMSQNGLEPATEIAANQPYVISMPNNAVYLDEYNQAGQVTFAASHATVEPAGEISVGGSGVMLMPALQRMAKSADVFAINRNEAYGDYAEGSVFVQNYREVRPFEAYVLQPAGVRDMIALGDLMDGAVTSILPLQPEDSDAGVAKVYTLAGILVATGQRSEVMKHLNKGVYIINGTKTVIK